MLPEIINQATAIGQLYHKAKSSFVDGLKYYVECGAKLKVAKDSMPHGEWIPWIGLHKEKLGFGESTARRLISVSKRALTPDLNEPEALVICNEMWRNSNHRAIGTGENDWHTPLKYINAAREVMGVIDLDPASSDEAQIKIDAERYFTPKHDGLTGKWGGRIWLNPPYSQPLIAQFIEKLIAEYKAGNVKEAIVLTHNYTDTVWFHSAESAAALICFTSGRIPFESVRGEIAQPTQGQVFFYYGKNSDKFKNVFSAYGFIR